MSWYRDHVFPRIMNLACNTKETRRIRSEVCAPLAGEVLEIGFGSGLNLPHLPPAVTCLRAVEPSELARDLAGERVAASQVDVEFVGLDGQVLELEDDSVDAAVATWTLCSIPDAAAAVREIGRVLRPGGTFHFAEHGRAPDANVQKWQDRLNGLQNRVACGCNLNRDIAAIIEDGGMTITCLDTFYAKGDPKVLGWTYQGSAEVSDARNRVSNRDPDAHHHDDDDSR
jgi:SAM-dependent methyltransferase